GEGTVGRVLHDRVALRVGDKDVIERVNREPVRRVQAIGGKDRGSAVRRDFADGITKCVVARNEKIPGAIKSQPGRGNRAVGRAEPDARGAELLDDVGLEIGEVNNRRRVRGRLEGGEQKEKREKAAGAARKSVTDRWPSWLALGCNFHFICPPPFYLRRV